MFLTMASCWSWKASLASGEEVRVGTKAQMKLKLPDELRRRREINLSAPFGGASKVDRRELRSGKPTP